MKRLLMLGVIALIGIFLSAPIYAAEDITGDQPADTSQSQMQEESQTQEKSGMEQTGMATEMESDEYAQGLKNLDGMQVIDANGENIGEISGMLVDVKSGRVDYLMLKSGGVFGMGGQHYPVPWQALKTRTDQEGFQASFTMEEMENAPKGTTITNRDQARQIYEFYGISPQWEEPAQTEERMKEETEFEHGGQSETE